MFHRTRAKTSWYWDLIDNGHAPSGKWTIWDELEEAEVEDLKIIRAKGVEEKDDEQSSCLKRVRNFQEMQAAKIFIDESLYDKFGMEISN